jgi:hypothetical protein
MALNAEQLNTATTTLARLSGVLSHVEDSGEVWNLFSRIQAEINEADQTVSDLLDACEKLLTPQAAPEPMVYISRRA